MSDAGKNWVSDQREHDRRIAESTVESGVWSDDLMWGKRWIGYAQFTGDAKSRKDGPYRLFKWRARLDARHLARKLKGMP